jgi:hypothetical protein
MTPQEKRKRKRAGERERENRAFVAKFAVDREKFYRVWFSERFASFPILSPDI